LAQVSKSYRDAVWSVDGVRSMEAKIKAYVQNIERREMFTEPMIWAAKYGNLPAVRALLKAGEGINKSLCRNNWTVLRVAAFHSHVALVKELIKAGADVNLQATDTEPTDILNYTALHLAAVTSHTTIIMELIKGGADVNIACSLGSTPLHIAARVGHEAGVVALMYAGADINAVTRTGRTPLYVAMHEKREKIVELLKHAGAVKTRSPGL
jgi:ankyrin repeat protein